MILADAGEAEVANKLKFLLGGITFLGTGIFVLLQGCSTQIAPVTAMVVQQAPPLPSNYISDFENNSIHVNRNLLGYPSLTGSAVTQLVPNGSSSGSSSSFNTGFWSDATYGGPGAYPNVINSPFLLPNAHPDATDSSNYAVHIGYASTPVTCIAVGGYESDQLTCTLENNPTNPYYDATPFINGGIAFYYNILPDDTATYRQVQVETINTAAPNYNHFHYVLPNGSSSGWKAVTVFFASSSSPVTFSYPGFGPNSGAITTTGPTTVAGTVYPANMSHFVLLQWQWSDNVAGSAGAPVTSFADFWIDNVQFIP